MAKYHMHKQSREITDKRILFELLERGKYVTIALCRENEPYIVTLNYGYDREKLSLYFHSAPKGLKIDFIRKNPDVCGTVIEDKGYMMGECAHGYRSVVFWGKMVMVENLDEKKYGLDMLLRHLEDQPGSVKERLLKDDRVYHDVVILRLDIHEISGKKGR